MHKLKIAKKTTQRVMLFYRALRLLNLRRKSRQTLQKDYPYSTLPVSYGKGLPVAPPLHQGRYRQEDVSCDRWRDCSSDHRTETATRPTPPSLPDASCTCSCQRVALSARNACLVEHSTTVHVSVQLKSCYLIHRLQSIA